MVGGLALEGHNARRQSPAFMVTVLEPIFAEEVFARCMHVAHELEQQQRDVDCIAVLRVLSVYLNAVGGHHAQSVEVAESMRKAHGRLRDQGVKEKSA